MSYSFTGYGAAAPPPGSTASVARWRTITGPQRLYIPPQESDAPPSGAAPGMAAPITPERCAAAGWYWDDVAQVCLEKAPSEDLPSQPDPTVPPPAPYDPELECIEAGGCWDSTLAQCLVCDDVGDEPVVDEPVIQPPVEPEDNTALYAGLALLLAAGLAGGYFLISRKKKKKGQP